MAKLIAVLGNVGAGKTTFAQRLCQFASYTLAREDHAVRAFHHAFAQGNYSAALANQMDYLLVRAEQEAAIRSGTSVGVLDGGLEQDFFVFTRYFAHSGLLTPPEYALCQRLYHFVRSTLPQPDLLIYLHAPVEVLLERYTRRQRTVEVIKHADIALLERFVQDGLAALAAVPTLQVDASADDPTFAATLATLREPLQRIVGP